MTSSIPFGKYAGVPLPDVPTSYLQWVIAETKLSSGLAASVRSELASRGVPVPLAPPAPRRACQKHPDAPLVAYWFRDSAGRPTVRGECGVCGGWLGTLPQTPEYVALADSGTSRTAWLDLLVGCQDAGVEVTRRGEQLELTPANRVTPELRKLERQARATLVPMMHRA